jgi:hypothetical protein
VAAPVQALAESNWSGTAAELLEALANIADDATKKSKNWPATPRTLGAALRRIAPNLRAVGVAVDFADQRELGSRRRQITITQKVDVPDRSQRSDRSDAAPERDRPFPGNDEPFLGNAASAYRNSGNDGNDGTDVLSDADEAEF